MRILIFLIISSIVFVCDQTAKALMQRLLSVGESIPLVEDFFHLTLVYNKGAAFGIFRDYNALFIAVAALVLFLIALYLPRIKASPATVNAALALIAGGILGNLVDRLRLGSVIDFLDFRVWPVFNLADTCISVGALLLVIKLLKK